MREHLGAKRYVCDAVVMMLQSRTVFLATTLCTRPTQSETYITSHHITSGPCMTVLRERRMTQLSVGSESCRGPQCCTYAGYSL